MRCGRGGGAVPYARVEGRRYRESGGCLVTEDRALGSGLWAGRRLGCAESGGAGQVSGSGGWARSRDCSTAL